MTVELSAGTVVERVWSGGPEQRYYLYVPASGLARERRLVVVVHGFSRTARAYVEHFAPYAEATGRTVLAPLFVPHYQRLGLGTDFRADHRLLAVVDEAARLLDLDAGRFELFGYSAGGQFVHRFLYLHARRVERAVVGAPGTVTLPDPALDWPTGLRRLAEAADARPDLAALRLVPTLLLVGAEDTGAEQLDTSEAANRLGANRVERLRTLHRAWERAGLPHAFETVPGVGHSMGEAIATAAIRFFLAGGPGDRPGPGV